MSRKTPPHPTTSKNLTYHVNDGVVGVKVSSLGRRETHSTAYSSEGEDEDDRSHCDGKDGVGVSGDRRILSTIEMTT